MTTRMDDLLTFLNSGEVSSASLRDAIQELGAKNVRVIAIELFTWLKRQRRFGHNKSLELKQQYAWCQHLPRLLQVSPELGELLEVQGCEVNFKDGVSAEERVRLRELVARDYRPALKP